MSHGHMNRWLITVAILFGVHIVGVPVQAEGDQEEGPNTGKIGFSGGNDISTHYFFRGILQEDQGFISQPWAEVGVHLLEADDTINSVGLVVGIWNSIHDEQTGADDADVADDADDGGSKNWYESDVYVGLVAGIGENAEAGVSYIAYTSPNDAFDTVQEIDLTFSYDDSGCWENIFSSPGFEGLQPSITIAFEVDNTFLGDDEGIYFEFAIAPTFILIENGDNPVILTIPVTAGFSISDYYEDEDGDDDDAFGYVDVGIFLSQALANIPPDYGEWVVELGVDLLFLGDNLETVNHDDDFEAIGVFRIGANY